MKAHRTSQCLTGLILAAALVRIQADTTNVIRLESEVPASCRSGGGGSFNPVFSGDGRSILFVSQARNLVTNDSPSPHLNLYVRDLAAGQTVLASSSASGVGGAEESANYPSISSNGQFQRGHPLPLVSLQPFSELQPGDQPGWPVRCLQIFSR